MIIFPKTLDNENYQIISEGTYYSVKNSKGTNPSGNRGKQINYYKQSQDPATLADFSPSDNGSNEPAVSYGV